MMSCCGGTGSGGGSTSSPRSERLRRREVKVLLLGSGESGKSTFVKQMNIIHGAGEFSADEVRQYRQLIYQNVVGGISVLLEARRKLSIPWEDQNRSESNCARLEQLIDRERRQQQQQQQQNSSNGAMMMTRTPAGGAPPSNSNRQSIVQMFDQKMISDLVPYVRELWADRAIKETFERRNRFQIYDSCSYFFDHIVRIGQPDYIPTNRDILFCRKATRGIIDYTFYIRKVPFRFIDVGGQRTQRQKWFMCFESVTSILFMVASSEYDQVLLEDRRTNRLRESRSLFETIVNHRVFVGRISIILFMNKTDLLQAKVPISDIRQYFREFPADHDSSNCAQVQQFLLQLFQSARRIPPMVAGGERERLVPIYAHWTTAIDTENIRRVFNSVKDIILEQNLRTLMMQ